MDSRLKFGDIVLLKFPLTDGKTFKRRPGLIINDFEDGDIIVCRVTSQIYKTRNDILIASWEKCGLKLPSVIRAHKIATLEKDMVQVLMGQIDASLKEEVRKVFQKLTAF